MAAAVAVIVFHCTSGPTETLAMSAAVGAVQGRALIRLRRVPDANPGQLTADPADHHDPRARMQKEYVSPSENDVLGADALLIVPPPGATPADPEWQPFLSLLRRLGAEGRLAGKVAAVVDTGETATLMAFSKAVLVPGLIMVPPAPAGADGDRIASATAHGRQVAQLAATLKPA